MHLRDEARDQLSADRRDDLQERGSPFEMDARSFREAGHALVEAVAGFLESLPARPVSPDESPSELRRLLPADALPEEGRPVADLLAEASRLLFDHSTFNGHPRFMGYVTSSAAPSGALADLLAAAVNPNVGGWQLAPMATEIEGQCVRWIADLLGFPRGGGLLVSGGNMANFVGFLAARRAAGGDPVRRRGVRACPELVAYGSVETHTWFQKAADLFGLGSDNLRWIAVDERQRMRMDALRDAVAADRAAGRQPFLVVGTAGTVSTGAVDPLVELAAYAREERLWLHVDGAYGGFAALAEDAPADLREGLGLADSIAIDPHKWLYAPIEAGCVLVRDREALRDTFSYTPAYYRFTGEDEPRENYYELGPQNSRGFRALKVWLAIRQAGRAGYARSISQDIALARALHRAAAAHPELEARTCNLSIATFRYVPPGVSADDPAARGALNELNEELLAVVRQSGEVFLSNAMVNDEFLLRACVVNFRTTLADVEAVPEIVCRHGRELAARRGLPVSGRA
jgi:aromatic-L-amino-acid/L-tryptophan decarboxylase